MIAVSLHIRYATMMAALVVAGVIGVLFLWMLFVAWRRAQARKHKHKPKAGRKRGSDLWQASGDRLVSRINQIVYEDKPPPPRGDTPPLEEPPDQPDKKPYDEPDAYEDDDDFYDDEDEDEDDDDDVQPQG